MYFNIFGIKDGCFSNCCECLAYCLADKVVLSLLCKQKYLTLRVNTKTLKRYSYAYNDDSFGFIWVLMVLIHFLVIHCYVYFKTMFSIFFITNGVWLQMDWVYRNAVFMGHYKWTGSIGMQCSWVITNGLGL